MAKKPVHKSKSIASRERYNRYIKTLDYEPTVDETLPFSQSNLSGEELSEPTSKRKRKIDTKQRILEHFSENWLQYVIVVFASVLVFLMYGSKIDSERIIVNLDVQKEDISALKSDIKHQTQKNYTQDININENRVRLTTLERWFNPDFDKNKNQIETNRNKEKNFLKTP